MDLAMKIIVLSILISTSITLMAGDNIHIKSREYFFIAGSESCKAHDLLRITETDSTGGEVIKAYKGAAYTMIADCVLSPIKKMKNFNTGKEIIDIAVSHDKTNPEIRFIRIMVQHGAPSFLDYNNLQEDMDVFMKAILMKTERQSLDEFDNKMLRAILSTGVPDTDQRNILNNLLSN